MLSVRRILLVFAVIFWPLALILDSGALPLSYLLPGILVGISLFFRQDIPLFIIPFISPKLALFPLLFFLFRKKYLHILISLIIFFVLFPFGQTIFTPDYEARQEIVRNTYLYPHVLLARVYQNKGYIYLNKFTDNLTQIIDPNNYFFANHPRELRDNPNLSKFPYPLIFFFLIGLFTFKPPFSILKVLSIYLLSSIINLSILTVPSGHDFILWPVIVYFIHQGLKNQKRWLLLLTLTLTLTEFIKLVL